MHGGSAGCPMASATSSVTLWLCSAGHPVHEWAILCPSEVVMHNRWCCLQSVNVHFHRIHPWCVVCRCQGKTAKDQNCRLPHVFCLRRPPSDFRLPDGVTPPRQNAPHRFCAPLASSRPRILQPSCRRWKWWCWGSRRHNEMFGSWGRWWYRKLARVCKYRQDATMTGVYIIFNDVK